MESSLLALKNKIIPTQIKTLKQRCQELGISISNRAPQNADGVANLTLEQATMAQKHLQNYLDIADSLEIEKRKSFDKEHVRAFLSRSGLQLKASDFDELFLATDVVEAYDIDTNQIFRNLELFKFTSYALEDLVTYHLSELYSRPKRIEEIILAEWKRVIETDTPDAIKLNIPPHLLRETMAEQRQIRIDLGHAWRLFDSQNNYAGILICQRASVLEHPVAGLI